MHSIDELKRYSEALENLAKNNSNHVFPNKNHKHAAIAISKILKYTKEEFILFDDELNGDISSHDEVESFEKSLISFMSRNGKAKFVVSDKSAKVSKLETFLVNVSELYPTQLEVKLASSLFKSNMRDVFKEKINYALGDDNKFRLEKFSNNPIHLKTREAEVSFNNKEVVKKIKNAFEDSYDSCTSFFISNDNC